MGLPPRRTKGNNTTSTTSLVSALTNAFVSGSNSELVNQMTSVFSGAITDVAGSNGSTTNATQSYLNWVMFDNFIVVSASSGHVPVSTSSNILHRLHEDNIAIGQKGYFYVWMSNERGDNFNVYFDDLKVTHTKGQILQEDHYYPFGATITALSSTAPLSQP